MFVLTSKGSVFAVAAEKEIKIPQEGGTAKGQTSEGFLLWHILVTVQKVTYSMTNADDANLESHLVQLR
jgi:hypothetical protein